MRSIDSSFNQTSFCWEISFSYEYISSTDLKCHVSFLSCIVSQLLLFSKYIFFLYGLLKILRCKRQSGFVFVTAYWSVVKPKSTRWAPYVVLGRELGIPRSIFFPGSVWGLLWSFMRNHSLLAVSRRGSCRCLI